MQTRKLNKKDAEKLFSILQSLYEKAAEPIGPEWSFEQVLEECLNGEGIIGVESGTSSNEIQAFVLWRELGAVREITFLGTAPSAQRRGLMRRLLSEVLGLGKRPSAPAAQTQAIWLEVHENNRAARTLYEQLGFKAVGRRPSYYRDGGAAIMYSFGEVSS